MMLDHSQCIYHQRNDSIHELFYSVVNEDTINEIIARIEAIIQTAARKSPTIRVLTEGQSLESQPVQFLLARMKSMMTQLPSQPIVQLAALYNPGPLTRTRDIVSSFDYGPHRLRVFKPDQRSTAISWLLES